MTYSLTLSETHLLELRSLLFKEDGFERPAIILCGRSSINENLWTGGGEERFLSYKILAIPQNEIIEHSVTHVSWNTTTFRRAMKIAKEEDLAICVVHNHPDDIVNFSEIDDSNEPGLFKGIFNRNGPGKPHASLVITSAGTLFGRIWNSNLKSEPLHLIRVVGDKFQFHYSSKYNEVPSEIFHRQQIAFGKTLTNDLSQITVGIVGCGATGSATAVLLSRLGVGKLLLVDNDLVERTNLNRLHYATASDADAGRAKVDVLAEAIAGTAIGCRVKRFKGWIGSKECRQYLKSCDIIFGCTDDHSGRIFLNRFAYFYLVPLFDVGIVIDLNQDKNQVQSIQGRMNVIMPGNNCLLCQGIVNSTVAAEENLRRTDPRGYQRLKEEGYVVGSDNPSPAVITFTTEISCVATSELINRITSFKKMGAQYNVKRFFEKGEDKKPAGSRRPDCPICDSKDFWGRGDIIPFMDQAY